jgi:solute carrier family 25 carnitine/acylcarnitine transporter 20/29
MYTSTYKHERIHKSKYLVDVIAGTLAGINITLVGQPFDTVKVLLQTQPRENPVYNGLVDCFKKTLKWEGISGFYEGVSSPLMGQIFFRTILFLTYGEAKRFFSQDGRRKIRIIEYYYCGAIAWGLGAIAECPIEFFKTQMQVQIIKAKTNPKYVTEYSSTTDCFKKIINAKGFIGMYQGFMSHFARNLLGGAVHFGTFEWIRLIYSEKYNVPVAQIPLSITMLAGCLGGLVFALLPYPIDVVKSAIQADSPIKEKKKYKNTIDAVKKLYAEEGCKRYLRGFSASMLRAAPANCALLATFTYVSEHLSNYL